MPDSPEVSIIYGLAANAGKDSSILLDLRSDQGRGALNELISWANVIGEGPLHAEECEGCGEVAPQGNESMNP